MKGAAQRFQREFDVRKWIAWHTAFLPYSKVRKLKDFMRSDDKTGSKRRQTQEEMLAAAKAWHQQINKGKS